MNALRPNNHGTPPQLRAKKQNLTSEERRAIVSTLLLSIKPDNPELKSGRGVINSVAHAYNVDRISIRRIWQRALANFHDPSIRAFISSPQKKGKSGRPIKWDRDQVRETVKQLPLHQRRTIRSLAAVLEIPKSSLFKMKQSNVDSVIMPVPIALKPLLTDVHKLQRVLFAVSKLSHNHQYHHFYDTVHVDEKWFFISEKQLRCYIALDEQPPERNAQNRDHLIKVMFLCAIARPRFNAASDCIFDGKIGMWPFVEQTVAQRRSVNRNRGNPVTKVVNCNRDTYRKFLIEKVIPAIRMKWPDRGMNRRVIIQHDGALAHIEHNDPVFMIHANQGVWDISLETQPAKSPDTNVLDLSFSRALQSKQWSLGSETTIDGLIRQVLHAFTEFEAQKIKFGFLTLQCCLDDLLASHGGNDYSICHIGKSAMLRNGTLPQTIGASENALHVYNLFSGHAGDVDAPGDKDPGDNNADAVQHMVWQVEAT
jgi:hypothetical protein